MKKMAVALLCFACYLFGIYAGRESEKRVMHPKWPLYIVTKETKYPWAQLYFGKPLVTHDEKLSVIPVFCFSDFDEAQPDARPRD